MQKMHHVPGRKYCGGITKGIDGEICRWGRIPEPFVMTNDPAEARRAILSDMALPHWVRAIAQHGTFIPFEGGQ